jgi:nitroreductase
MDLFEAIHGRFSAGQLKPDTVPRPLVEKLLAAAVQAPNHYKVRPWRFVVLTGTGREQLGAVMSASIQAARPDIAPEVLEKTLGLPLRAPVLIVVGVDPPSEAKIIEVENVCAVAAACQNLLLAAHAEGLAVRWRTGEWAREPAVKQFLGFASDQQILAFLYVGYPDGIPAGPERPSFSDRTVWID